MMQVTKETMWNSKLMRKFLLVLLDIIGINLSVFLAALIRYDLHFSQVPESLTAFYIHWCPVYTIIVIMIFMLFRLYNSLWEYASVRELMSIIAACGCVAAFSYLGTRVMRQECPGGIFWLNAFFLLAIVTGTRFFYRGFRHLRSHIHAGSNSSRVLIIGAGEAGYIALKEILNSNYVKNKKVVNFIDDDPKKRHQTIYGVKVYGDRTTIPECVKRQRIDEIILAIPTASPKDRREILSICSETDCAVSSLPGVYQLMNGEVNVSRIRPITIEDLLGREAIDTNVEDIMGYVQDKVVLVTGGGGSIGSELCRQIAKYQPKQLIIFDIYENNAYDIQQELLYHYPELNLKVLIGSVRNTSRLEYLFSTYRPDIVYHAAAHKHVPLMEDSPNEAIKNNVQGTFKTATMADRYEVKKFILISTDKAVNPTNIMGASKRMCEMIVQYFSRHSKTEFVAVRFGNVLGSNGSVIPLFKKQIEAGGPVTVTHPDIIRYFMTIPEAVSLVLQAGARAKGGEIFVLDMGEPVKILDLAQNMIRLSGFSREDIAIEFTGLRPGEKLYEELLMDEEGLQSTEDERIHIARPILLDDEKFMEQLAELDRLANNEADNLEMKKKVHEIVPTYTFQQQDN